MKSTLKPKKSGTEAGDVPVGVALEGLVGRDGHLTPDALLLAEIILAGVTQEMQAEYKASDGKWPRAWMQKHVSDQVRLINARKVLVDRAEKIARSGSVPPSHKSKPVVATRADGKSSPANVRVSDSAGKDTQNAK